MIPKRLRLKITKHAAAHARLRCITKQDLIRVCMNFDYFEVTQKRFNGRTNDILNLWCKDIRITLAHDNGEWVVLTVAWVNDFARRGFTIGELLAHERMPDICADYIEGAEGWTA